MNPDPSDLLDKLDVSTSSIDMANTSLAMHEEKESEMSGIGEKTQWKRGRSECSAGKMRLSSLFCCAAELENSALLSLSAENQEPVSQSAEDLPAARTTHDASSDLGGPSAEASHLVAESADPHGFPTEPSGSLNPPEEALVSVADEPPSPPPLDLVPPSLSESPADRAPPQTTEHTRESECESRGSAHQCDHQHSEEETDLMWAEQTEQVQRGVDNQCLFLRKACERNRVDSEFLSCCFVCSCEVWLHSTLHKHTHYHRRMNTLQSVSFVCKHLKLLIF